MSVEKRAKKRKYWRNFRISLILVIILYMFIRNIFALYVSNLRTQTVEKGIIEDSISSEGIIIKNENIYTSQIEGKVRIFLSEGDRVRVHTKILELDANDKSSQLEAKLTNIDNRLKDVKAQKEGSLIFKSDIKKNNAQIEVLINEIRNNLMKKNYKEVNDLKNKLEIVMDKQDFISGSNTLLSDTIKNLEEERKGIIKQIEENSKVYHSDTCGLVSYNIDGLEKIYNTNNIMEYKVNDFRVIEPAISKISDDGNVRFGQPLFKVIDNYEWYVMVKLSNDGIQSFENGKDVLLEFDNKDIIKSRIVNINKDKNETLIILKNNDYFYKFYNERYVNVKIIVNKYEGFKILSKSIIKKDGIEGVYIKDISGIVKFRPIKILAKNEGYTIVEEGNVYGYIEVEKGNTKSKVKTIELYDEVFINTSNIKEGQIINSL